MVFPERKGERRRAGSVRLRPILSLSAFSHGVVVREGKPDGLLSAHCNFSSMERHCHTPDDKQLAGIQFSLGIPDFHHDSSLERAAWAATLAGGKGSMRHGPDYPPGNGGISACKWDHAALPRAAYHLTMKIIQ